MIGIFLDTETNGLSFNTHKLLELAFQMIDLNTGTILDTYESCLKRTYKEFQQSDPASLKINGFTWEKIQKGKEEQKVKQEVLHIFESRGIDRKNSVFICQNPSFDRFFFSELIPSETQETLYWPYHWLDLASMYFGIVMKQAQEKKGPLPWELGFTKNHIAEAYNIGEEETPHRAINGVKHLVKCYEKLVGFPEKSVPSSS